MNIAHKLDNQITINGVKNKFVKTKEYSNVLTFEQVMHVFFDFKYSMILSFCYGIGMKKKKPALDFEIKAYKIGGTLKNETK